MRSRPRDDIVYCHPCVGGSVGQNWHRLPNMLFVAIWLELFQNICNLSGRIWGWMVGCYANSREDIQSDSIKLFAKLRHSQNLTSVGLELACRKPNFIEFVVHIKASENICLWDCLKKRSASQLFEQLFKLGII